MSNFARAFLMTAAIIFSLSGCSTQTSAAGSGNWEPLNFPVSPAVGNMNWTPALKVLVYYDHPDRVVNGTGVFVNRNVNPDSVFNLPPAATRDSMGMDEDPQGANVSIAAMKGGEIYNENDGKTAHQRDWDFIVSLRDKILEEKALLNSSDTVAKMKALADYTQTHRGITYESRHGVDTLLHSSYCVGAANANAAFASTMGLDVRTINTSSHSTTEVEIDGKWYWIDNSIGVPTMLGGSLMRLCVDPDDSEVVSKDAKYKKRIGHYNPSGNEWLEGGAIYLLSPRWWHYNQGSRGSDKFIRCQTLLNGAGVAVGLDGTTAKALYPNEREYLIKPTASGAMLVAGKYSWWYSGLRISSGQAVRRVFYLGKLDDPANPVKKVELQLLLDAAAANLFPENGAGWYLRVNGKIFPLDAGTLMWQAETLWNDMPSGYLANPAGITGLPESRLTFALPISALAADGVNTVEFGAAGSAAGQMTVMIFPDPMQPYFPPYNPGNGPRQELLSRIEPDHICEITRVAGFEYSSDKPYLQHVYPQGNISPADAENGVTFEWTPLQNCTGKVVYELWYSKDGDFKTSTVFPNLTETKLTIKDLPKNNLIFWQVRATNKNHTYISPHKSRFSIK